MTEKQIRDRLVREVADAAQISTERVDSREPFATYGLGSLEAVYLVGQLEEWLGVPLDATLLWDHPTIDALAKHLTRVVTPT
ncbi:MAG TPA: acyl carrier protein [Kofleriaceae bacterium]|jgi:acyl carrier protein